MGHRSIKGLSARRIAVVLVTLSVLIMGPVVAYSAPGDDPFTEPPGPTTPVTASPSSLLASINDDFVFYQMLRQIIGPGLDPISDKLFGTGGGASVPSSDLALAAILFRFVAAIAVVFGATLLAYITVIGTLKSAQSGTFLGKWDTQFVPLRVILGLGAAMPIPTFGGLCFAQLVVVLVTLLGVSMANAAWMFSSAFLLNDYAVEPAPRNPAITQVADQLFLSNLCEAVINQSMGTYPVGRTLQQITISTDTSWMPFTEHSEEVYAINGRKECGAYDVERPDGSGEMPAASAQIAAAAKNGLLNTLQPGISQIVTQLVQAHEAGTLDWNGLESLAQDYADVKNNYATNLIAQTQSAYAGSSYLHDNTELLLTIQKNGFALAGSYYYIISMKQDQINNLISNAFDQIDYVDSLTEEGVPVAFRLESTKARMEQYYAFYMQIQGRAYHYQDSLGIAKGLAGDDGAYDAITNFLFAGIFSGAQWLVEAGSPGMPSSTSGLANPMAQIRAVGNAINHTVMLLMVELPLAESMMGYIPGLGTVVDVVTGPLTDMPEIVQKLGTIFMLLISSLFGAGILLGYVVPLLPYALWLMAIVSLLLYFIEAMFASPFGAVMHAHPEGGDVVGRGGAAYPILVTLLFKPLFMIGGFVVGMILFRVAAWFVNSTVQYSFAITRIDTAPNLLSLFVIFALYGVLLVIVAYRCFSLPSELSKAMLRWMGVNDAQDLGERDTHSQVVGVVSGGLGRIATPAGGVLSGATGGPGGGGGGRRPASPASATPAGSGGSDGTNVNKVAGDTAVGAAQGGARGGAQGAAVGGAMAAGKSLAAESSKQREDD